MVRTIIVCGILILLFKPQVVYYVVSDNTRQKTYNVACVTLNSSHKELISKIANGGSKWSDHLAKVLLCVLPGMRVTLSNVQSVCVCEVLFRAAQDFHCIIVLCNHKLGFGGAQAAIRMAYIVLLRT